MFLYSKWLETPGHIRAKIAQEFGLEKIRPTHVSNNIVVDDGYNIKDVERVMGTKSLKEFFKTYEEDDEVLFGWIIEWAEGKREKPTEETILVDIADLKKYEESTEDKGGNSEGSTKQGGKRQKA